MDVLSALWVGLWMMGLDCVHRALAIVEPVRLWARARRAIHT